MPDYQFRLAGKVTIPKEKKDEFSQKVLTILDRGGIRKTETMQISGKDITVVVPALPDENGKVWFDYSIFEKDKKEAASFDMNTGELSVPDSGYKEFMVIMNTLLVLQEAYSSTPCFLTYMGKPFKIDRYVDIIEAVLDEKIKLNNGAEVWEIYRFFHYSTEYDDIDINKALKVCLDWLRDPEQLIFAFDFDESLHSLSVKTEVKDRKEVCGLHRVDKEKYLYQLIEKHSADAGFEQWLREVLSSDLEKRKKLSEMDDDHGLIAELAMYFHSQVIARLYSISTGEEFWDVWERLNVNGYTDIIWNREEWHHSDKLKPLPFYRAIKRETQDEFLEWWDGENLKLSEELEEHFKDRQKTYDKLKVVSEMDAEKMLGNILYEMKKYWYCRYVDKKFVDEILSHKEDGSYLKILMVLWLFLNEPAEYYPELTRRQAIEWIIRRSRDPHDAVSMAAFTALIANNEQRERIFGV